MNEDDLLELFVEHEALTEDQASLVNDTQAGYGGTLLRTLETQLSLDEADRLWSSMAAHLQRPYYRTGREIETLEEPVPGGRRLDIRLEREVTVYEPLLSRAVSGHHLALAHRREWDTLCVLTSDLVFDTTAPELCQRAREVSPTGVGRVRAAVLSPPLYRQCYGLAYPEGLYGPLSLVERLSLQGLCPLGRLEAYTGHEQHLVGLGLITEQDYAVCLAADLHLPLYDYTRPTVDWRVLPQDLIEQLGVLPLRRTADHVEVLTSTAPTTQMTQQLQRQGGAAVTYQITTPTVIRRLLDQRNTYVHQNH